MRTCPACQHSAERLPETCQCGCNCFEASKPISDRRFHTEEAIAAIIEQRIAEQDMDETEEDFDDAYWDAQFAAEEEKRFFEGVGKYVFVPGLPLYTGVGYI